MPSLLNSSVGLKGTTGTNTYFITLSDAQPLLGNTPTTSTGYTLVTGPTGQLGFSNVLGNISFNNRTLYSSIPNNDLILKSTGTANIVLGGNVFISGNLTATGNTVLINPSISGTIDNAAIGNSIPSSGNFTTLNVQNEVVSNYFTATGGFVGTLTSISISSELNVTNTTTVYDSLTVLGLTAITPDNQDVTIHPGGTGRVYINSGGIGYLDNLIIGLNSPQAGFFTNLTVQSLNIQQSFNLTTASITSLTVSDLSVTDLASIHNMNVTGITTLTNVIANNITSSLITSAGAIVTGTLTATSLTILTSETDNGTLNILGNTSATSTTTGALIVSGGVGIGGNLYVGGTFYAGGQAVLTTSSFAGAISGGSDIQITTTSSGTIIVFNDTSTFQSVTNRGATTTNVIYITNPTQSFSTTTGALLITGGVGLGGNIHVNGSSAFNSVTCGQLTQSSYNFNINGFDGSNSIGGAITSGTFNIANGQNSATIILGSTTGTGAITIGQSTSSQTLNIATGLNAAGSIKTLNIGSNGQNSSTTLVNIGSAVNGSITTTTIYGQLISIPGNISRPYIGSAAGMATYQSTATFTDMTSNGAVAGSWSANYLSTPTFTATTTATYNGGVFNMYIQQPNIPTNSNVIVGSGYNAFYGGSYSLGVDSLYVAGGFVINGYTNNIGLGSGQTSGGIYLGGSTSSSTGTIVVGQSPATQLVSIANGATTNGSIKTVNIGTGGTTGSITNIVIGTSTSTSTIFINGNVTFTNQQTIYNVNSTTVSTSTVTLDSFASNTYRSAKYFISISNIGLNLYQTSEIWLIQDGTNANIEQTSVFSSSTNVVIFSAAISAGTVSLLALGSNNNNVVKMHSEYIPI